MEINNHHFIVLKTNLQSAEDLAKLNIILTPFYPKDSWSVDLEDVDKVLRVPPLLSEEKLLILIKESGFECEVLA